MAGVIYRVYGVVQGVGFRPFVHRIASKYQITGEVKNKGSYVEVTACGSDENLQLFKQALTSEAPLRADIKKVETLPYSGNLFDSFAIVESEADSGVIFIPPDIATCPECKAELFDPNDRRYLHSFINCTACGPRLTILEALPYDRERTSMKKFPMCPECQREYDNISSRRYDAQPVCCNDCGPKVYLLDTDLKDAQAITRARELIISGKIVAVKGIGGFHLVCDGRNPEAIMRLRELKHRPAKPLAVMMRNMDTVKKYCRVTEKAETWLDGAEKPILLLEKRADCTLPEALAPGNPTLGVMLPYAPLQMLLFDYPDNLAMSDVLVMTSGNVSGAPICRREEDAKREIGSFCDAILSHNRDIRLQCDDSVMQFYNNEPYMIRRSRGFAPLPIPLEKASTVPVLAIGGELKNAFAIGRGNMAYIAPHIGDMEDVRSVKALQEAIELFSSMLECKVQVVVCDMHPGYHTTMLAENMNLKVIKVQHHYAHILSCMAENNCMEPLIGVALDGTGYGCDGAVWGGEIMLTRLDGFERLAHWEYFPLPGGDAAAREGWRTAVGILNRFMPDQAAGYAEKLALCNAMEFKVISSMVKNKLNTVETSSTGRLFDAVSALLGIKRISTFEGEAAMALQFAAEKWLENNPEVEVISFAEKVRTQDSLPVGELCEYLLELKLNGEDVNYCAYIFHRAVADMIIEACCAAGRAKNINICALSGGSFQNTLLLDMVVKGLQNNGFHVLTHRLVPCNDGGISLGQLLAGNQWCEKENLM